MEVIVSEAIDPETGESRRMHPACGVIVAEINRQVSAYERSADRAGRRDPNHRTNRLEGVISVEADEDEIEVWVRLDYLEILGGRRDGAIVQADQLEQPRLPGDWHPAFLPVFKLGPFVEMFDSIEQMFFGPYGPFGAYVLFRGICQGLPLVFSIRRGELT